MNYRYIEFKNDNEVEIWLDSHYKKFFKYLYKNVNNENTLADALFCYTGSMSMNYNNILKLNNGAIDNIDFIIEKYYDYDKDEIDDYFIKDAKNNIKKIYNAFKLNEICDDIILYHYFHYKNYEKNFLENDIYNIKHFISTTLLKDSQGILKLIDKNKYDAVLIIKVNKGTECIPIGNNPNSCLKEHEIILKPNSKFKIIKCKRKFFGKIKNIIECELVG